MPGGGLDLDATRQPPKPSLVASQHDKDIGHIPGIGRHDWCFDDLTGQSVLTALCMEARATELEYFKEKGVWVIKRISEVVRQTGKRPITVSCVWSRTGGMISTRASGAG